MKQIELKDGSKVIAVEGIIQPSEKLIQITQREPYDVLEYSTMLNNLPDCPAFIRRKLGGEYFPRPWRIA